MRARTSFWSTALTLTLALGVSAIYVSCSAGEGSETGDGTGASGATSVGGGTTGFGGNSMQGGFSSGGGTATGAEDCGYATFPTEREPGLLLLVYDQSCSMVECPGGTDDCVQCSNPSKWELARDAMNTVLPTLPDDLRMGIILYPSPNVPGPLGCNVETTPQVAPGPLSQTRTQILAELNITPDGGGTPTLGGLETAYATFDAIADSGNKAALLVTDGAWNCGNFNLSDLIYNAAGNAYDQKGYQTFVVGIQAPSASLSHLAHRGGTDRVPGCNWQPLFNTCESSPNTCCNYTVGQNVTAELAAALDAVASQLLTSCVFPLPKGSDPTQFDPNKVNVYVDGEVVPPDPDQGWAYTGGGTDYIEIFGALCDELLAGEKDNVTIQLGCPTIPPT